MLQDVFDSSYHISVCGQSLLTPHLPWCCLSPSHYSKTCIISYPKKEILYLSLTEVIRFFCYTEAGQVGLCQAWDSSWPPQEQQQSRDYFGPQGSGLEGDLDSHGTERLASSAVWMPAVEGDCSELGTLQERNSFLSLQRLPSRQI